MTQFNPALKVTHRTDPDYVSETVDKYLGLPMVPRRGSQIRRSIKFRGPQSLRDCNYVIDGDGIYVFKPTPRQYSCFAELLSLMEGTAGRAQGAVKVVVPEQW